VRYGCRDANHAHIRDGLRAHGHRVLDLGDVGKGCPDLLVRHRSQAQRMRLLEVKRPGKREDLTPAEVEFRQLWGDAVVVVETLAEALAAL